MFGYVKPYSDELKVKDNNLYKCAYCGLCRSLKGSIGCFAHMTLSYDFVFLALFATALNNDSLEIEYKTCPVHPLKKIPVVKSNESFEKSSKMSAVLTYFKVKDDISDGNIIEKIVKGMTLPFVYGMKKSAKVDEDELNIISSYLKNYYSLEKDKCDSADTMAMAFGKVLGEIFKYPVMGDKEKEIAAACGNILGKWIYLVDAIDDYSQDKKKNRYNPLLLNELPSYDGIEDALILTLKDFDGIMLLTDFKNPQIESIIKNIVYLGLPSVGKNTVNKLKKEIEKTKEMVK